MQRLLGFALDHELARGDTGPGQGEAGLAALGKVHALMIHDHPAAVPGRAEEADSYGLQALPAKGFDGVTDDLRDTQAVHADLS